jgi:hypothetical protein
VPPQKSPKKQEKATAAEKTKGGDRDWLTTAEAATKLGWREHSLRDALRDRDLPGIHRTAFGYKIDASAVDAIGATLGPAPAKGNSSLKKRAPGGSRVPPAAPHGGIEGSPER